MNTIVYLCFVVLLWANLVLSQLVCRDGQLRLDNDKRLWACSSGQWGTVCNNGGFYMEEATVSCKNLGYSYESSGITIDSISGATGFIALGSLDCSGDEDYLNQCVQSFDYLNDCDHSMDVKLTCPSLCSNNDLRLINGFSANEGTLEICKDGSWNTICRDGFGGQEAFVACRQLGLNASTAEVKYVSFGTGHGWAEHTKFLCTGEETSLSDCDYTPSNSCLSYDPYTGHVAIAQLVCSGDPAPGICSGSGIRINNNGEIALKGIGRLELCQSGAWGTVNNNMFSVKDALVACRQLGVPSPSTQVYPQGYFANHVAGPIILRDLVCLGSESSLYTKPPLGCSYGLSTVDLDHTTDVFLNCWTKVGVSCNDGDVRLVHGSTKDEGRAEVCLGEEWGTFCDTFWDRREAQVICRQLGYPNSYGAYYVESAFGTGDQVPYFYTDLNCTGSESGIVACPFSDQIEGEKCLFGRAVGVKCYNNTGCTDGSVQLVGGNKMEGDVQICRNGVWGYICGEDWNEKEAEVYCRSQGYSDILYGKSKDSLFGGGQSTAPIVYDAITCNGNEQSLTECTTSEYASLYPTCLKVAGVTCLLSDDCNAGDVRLQDGSSSSEGRLEVCTEGSWTTVRSSEIQFSDAQVICSQLGYDPEWSVTTEGNVWGTGNRMVYYDQINCVGNEASISACNKVTVSSTDDANMWYNDPRAGISCEKKSDTETCTESGAIRLKDGPSAREGRLEICLNSYWGSVCNRGWTQNNGLVACRQAGFETLRPLLKSAVSYDDILGPVNVHNLQCNGHESRLTECQWSNAIGYSTCYHDEDVALLCNDLPNVYSVINITSNLKSPFPIGTQVTFTCEGAPQTEDIFYYWSRDNVDLGVSSDPTVTISIEVNFPKSFNIYCKVYRSNEFVAVGRQQFTVQDILTVKYGNVVTVTTGNDVTLSFQRQYSHINSYLRNLKWTFDGVNDVNTSNPRYTLSEDGLSLTITDVTLEDIGLYSIQYSGLNLQEYNEFCEDMVFSLLRDYPVFSSAYILLTLPDFFTDAFDHDPFNHLLAQSYEIQNYTLGDSLVVMAAVRFGALPTETLLEAEWYFNGAQYLASSKLSSRDHVPLLEYIVENPVLFDSGYYEVLLKYPFEDLMRNLQCTKEFGRGYFNFMQSADFLGFEDGYFVADTAVLEARYNEKPTAQLTVDKSSFAVSDNSTIVCTSSGGYPRYYDVTIWKNGVTLKQGTGASIEYSTADSPNSVSKYGEYSCVVNNMLLEDIVTITVANEAYLSWPFGNINCATLELNNVVSAVLQRLRETCNCELNNVQLKDSVLDCELGQSTATINTTLVYTNGDGSLIADDIVNQTLTDFNNRPPDPSEPFELSDGAAIGITFVGGFLAGALIFIIAIVIIVLKCGARLKAKDDESGAASKHNQVLFSNQSANVKMGADDDDMDEFNVPPPTDDD